MWGLPGWGFVYVDNLPTSFVFDQNAAFVVLAVGNGSGLGISHREHECVADHGRVPIQLQPWLPQIIAVITGCARPTMLNHKKVKVQAILAVRRDKPFIQ